MTRYLPARTEDPFDLESRQLGMRVHPRGSPRATGRPETGSIELFGEIMEALLCRVYMFI